MQLPVKQSTKLRFGMMALACHIACLSISSAMAQTASETVANGNADTEKADAANKNTVTITGKKVGMGLMVQEDAPKARSTVTAEELAKERPTGGIYEAMKLMPSVNSYSYDGSGMFGGGITMRGFNSNELGATINGVPVNDSGNFAIYPQEYVDQENTCTETVTQGSTDVDSPQVGASGGNFNITTCDPENVRRIRAAQTVGQLNLAKTYLRFDSGLLSDERTKYFISASDGFVDKWKGQGDAHRDHVDVGVDYDIDRFDSIHATVLINKEVANNINSISLSQLHTYGYDYDFSPAFAGHAIASPGKGVSDPAEPQSNPYYGLSLNPFENVVASATAKFRLNPDTDLKIIPYFWYGYGTGGSQQKLLAEGGFLNPATGKANGGLDLNGDGDTLDKVWVYSSSVTRTQRPGVTASVTENIGDNNQLLAGVWYERAQHRQTGPAELLSGSGQPADIWLRGNYIVGPDGAPYESRNWLTVSPAWQVFLQDTVSLMDNKLLLNIGVRTPNITRDFTNIASEGAGSGKTYEIERTYSDVLPQFGARLRITNDDQFFASLAKNMKAPPNSVFAPVAAGGNVTLNSAGVPTLSEEIKPETSWDLDIGYRHQTNAISASVTAFFTDFQNRQAIAFDPNTLISTTTNAGHVENHGIEVEVGNTPVHGWSFYGSLGYIVSTMESNLQEGVGVYLPTSGKEFPLTPKWKAGLSASYETNRWYYRLKGAYTGDQQATLVNDEEVPGYTVVDFDAGYLLPNFAGFKNSKLTFNVSNLLDRQYRNPSSQSVTNATAFPGVGASTVFYYLGAPRMASLTLRLDY